MLAKEIAQQFKSGKLAAYEKFELMEKYSSNITEVADIDFLIEVVKNDDNSIIRHEASAQLLRVELKKPHLLNQCRAKAEDCLINIYYTDNSLVARHEAIESLSHVGRNKSIAFLEKIDKTETNDDIKKTIEISLGFLLNRKLKQPHLFEE